MPLPSGNINSVLLVGDQLRVSGTSSMVEGRPAVARAVGIQQPPKLEKGTPRGFSSATSSLGENWRADLPAEDAGSQTGAAYEFECADALVVATETFFVADNDSEFTASFLTFTWSEVVTIEPG